MLLSIISDTHDNLAMLKKAVGWMNKNNIKQIIHCGDICSPYTLGELSKMFAGKIHIVFGNVDGDVFTISQQKAAGELPNVVLCGEVGELKINVSSSKTLEAKKIAFVHCPKIAKALASSGQYNMVFYGHTHKPWKEKIKKCRLVNPGNLCGILHKPTFAIYDTKNDKLELKILEKIIQRSSCEQNARPNLFSLFHF